MEAGELRRRREALRLTQADLARALGVARNTVARWERGELPISRPALVAAALDRLEPQLTPIDAVLPPARPQKLSFSVPAELTSFIGREQLLAELEQLLGTHTPGSRLVTLTGPGGTGKTRVALRVAARTSGRFEDGVCVVLLAPISDARLVAYSIAQALGVPDAGTETPQERLKSFVGYRQLLLVLDNFEQVLDAAPELPELLASCPRLQLLVTSRAALRVSGEREVAVSPLALPAALPALGAIPASLAVARESESVQLFLERARAVNGDFTLTADNAPAVAQICVRLDGLPLAIELAAARIRLLDPRSLLTRLDHRLPLLTDGARDLPARHRTLRNTIAWSYDLLDPPEQTLFRLLAVFVDGCTLEAVQAVSLSETDVLESVDSLATKSLVRSVVVASAQARLTMLETTREFGLELLGASGELEAVRRRHAVYYLSLAERAEPELWGPAARSWLDRLAADHNNMRAALEWGLNEGGSIGSEIALKLAGALARYWWTRSHTVEGQQWLERALAAVPGRTKAHMKALYGAGWLAHFRRDSATARSLIEESLAIARELGDQWAVAWTLHCLGRVASFDGDYAGTRALAEQSLAIAEELGDQWLIAWALHLLGLAAHHAGDYATADFFYERSLVIRQRLGHHESIGVMCQLRGATAYRRGRFLEARQFCQGYLEMSQELGSPWHLSNALAQFASLAAAQQQPERAARLIGAAAVINETFRARPIPLIEELFMEGVGLARQALGETAFAVAMSKGQAMTPEEAIAEALAVEVPPPGGPTRAPLHPAHAHGSGEARLVHSLTEREREVAAFVAHGLTNRQIAAELVVTERTVAAHVEHILDKLGYASRTQIGVWAAAQEARAGTP